MASPLFIFLVTFLWIVLIGAGVDRKIRLRQEDLRERMKNPDVDDINEILERTREPVPTTRREKKEYELDQSGVKMTIQKYYVSKAGWSLVAFAFGYMLFQQSTAIAAMVGAVAWFIPDMQIKRKRKQNMELFSEQFRNTLIRISGSLRAGDTMKQAVMSVAQSPDSHEIIRKEFQRVSTDLEFNYTPEQAFQRMYARTGSEDVHLVAIVTEINRQKGGNQAELLDSIQHQITERANQKRRLKTLTAQQRGQANLLTAIPFVVYVLVMIVSPGYFDGFMQSSMGTIILMACIGTILVGNLIMRKMTESKE